MSQSAIVAWWEGAIEMLGDHDFRARHLLLDRENSIDEHLLFLRLRYFSPSPRYGNLRQT